MKSKAPIFYRRDDQAKPEDVTIFSGGGEMGERIRNFDWSKTPLGPIEQWPQSLVTSVQIMLASPRPIWIGWGKELNCLYNDPYKAIVVGRHPTALGKPWREIWPEIWDMINPMLQRVMGALQGIYIKEQLLILPRHEFSEETYCTYSFTPIQNEGGIGGIICTSSDDTQRVFWQRRISLLQELAPAANTRNMQDVCSRLKDALVTNLKDLPFVLIYLLDGSGKTLVLMCAAGISRDHPAVPASIALSGDGPWPVAQVLQSNSFRVVDVAHYSDLPCGFWAQSPEKAVVFPLTDCAKGGCTGIVVAGLNPFLQFGGQYQSFLSVVVSQIAAAITNAWAYEAELKSFEREQAARRQAEDAMRAKDRFLAALSHELRTPLSPVLLIASDAAANPDLPPNVRVDFETIVKNVEVEAQLIDDLLDVSRISYGKLKLKLKKVDAHKVLREALHTVESQIQNKRIQTAIEFKAEQHFILADSVRLQQIFWNILHNAVKFTPEKGKISIETFLTEGNSRFGVRITDSGIGMTPKELTSAFSAFAQGEHTKDRSVNYGGLGLGLRIAKRLVELHSGTIQTTSEGRGRGSTFTIEFPLAKAQFRRRKRSQVDFEV